MAFLPSQEELVAADGYGFDYVMVFKAEPAGAMTTYSDRVVRQIMAAGLTARVYLSYNKEEIFCEIRASVERLMQFADQVDGTAARKRQHFQKSLTFNNLNDMPELSQPQVKVLG